MILQLYNFFMEKFFALESLPTILQPVSEELCALCAILVLAFILCTVVGLFRLFFRLVTGISIRG